MAKQRTTSAPVFEGRWFHIISTAYGAWLYGDSRGFRTRHHREHVVGDYKQPPAAGSHTVKRRRSAIALKQPPVRISPTWRPVIGNALRQKLEEKGAFTLCMAVSSQHVHISAKLPRLAKPRLWMGIAKKHTTFEVKDQGWTGKLWGKRGKEDPIKDRRHQLNVYRYILAHAVAGAWVWDWMKDKDRTG